MPQIHLKISESLNKKITALASAEQKSKSEVVRNILEHYTAENAAENSLDLVSETIRKVIKSELRRTEDRLAKIAAKNTIAAATAMYLNTLAIEDCGKRNAIEFYKEARKKAVAFLQSDEKEDS
ncbi:hypothetical protein [Zhaonella formicivorans]|uniref:hypothetical protein n=1 Tax=Zhaonella formicivorans TaxID=2528593 RepID=UPI0010D4306E|nr:hypothetical protein [Zhaonella formicivorans]